jgi:hypothetical protein
MKKITNWKNATVADLESDNLLDEATMIHILSCEMQGGKKINIQGEDHSRIKKFFQYHIDNEMPVVVHNGISFDIPLVEKLLGVDLSEVMVIDSLYLSWYLSPNRVKHGLDSFFEDYGIAKPKIDDWENLTRDEYTNRCREDVNINKALWEDQKSKLLDMYSKSNALVSGGSADGTRASSDEFLYIDNFKDESVEESIDRLLTFLMFKADCARLQEKTKWKVDVDLLSDSIENLKVEVEAAKAVLESVMPKVPQYFPKSKPAKPWKKNGELSASGQSWENTVQIFNNKTLDEFGTRLVIESDKPDTFKVLKSYEEPNANGSDQVKQFLYSKGWKPESFKYEKDEEAFNKWITKKPVEGSNRSAWTHWKNTRPKERAIPQITVVGDSGKELCHSIARLAEEVPEINAYARFNVSKHRLGLLKGFERNLTEGGYLKARVGGLTNTLRVKHAEIVNLPGVDKLHGDLVRGVLVAEEGKVLIGSDMSSLEDRVKHHFMLAHDPEYVKTMQEADFDPHILMALTAKMITQEEYDNFKAGIKSDNAKAARKKGKTTNYASVYNAGAAKIAQAAGVSLDEGKALHTAYWKLNWSVKAIADEQVVIEDSRGGKWLVNPINGFCYSLRKESDRFSTLCQGTGSYFFDMWVDETLNGMENKWGKSTLTGSFHDEQINAVKDSPVIVQDTKDIIASAIDKVNIKFKLRRLLGCESQVGKRYSEIH